MNSQPQPRLPVDAALLDLLEDSSAEVRKNTQFRPVLASALDTLGYSQAEIESALSKLYRTH